MNSCRSRDGRPGGGGGGGTDIGGSIVPAGGGGEHAGRDQAVPIVHPARHRHRGTGTAASGKMCEPGGVDGREQSSNKWTADLFARSHTATHTHTSQLVRHGPWTGEPGAKGRMATVALMMGQDSSSGSRLLARGKKGVLPLQRRLAFVFPGGSCSLR